MFIDINFILSMKLGCFCIISNFRRNTVLLYSFSFRLPLFILGRFFDSKFSIMVCVKIMSNILTQSGFLMNLELILRGKLEE